MTTPPPPDMSDPGPATADTPLPRSGSMGWLHLLVVLAVVGAAAWFLLFLAALARIPSVAVYLVFFVLLLRLVRTARRLDPFTALSARRLRFLGGLLAGGAVGASLAESIIRAQLSAALTVSRTSFYTWAFPFSAVISGFGLVVVAELLRRGGMMRADLEGTI